MKVVEIADDIHERAQMVADLAQSQTTAATEMLQAWVHHDPRAAAETMLALALMADRDKAVKSAHAAYMRGNRTESVMALEREYQRKRKQKARRVQSELRAISGGGAA